MSGAPQNYVTLPQTAIAYNPYGNMVYRRRQQGQGRDGKPQLDRAARPSSPPGRRAATRSPMLKGVKEGDDGRHRRPDQAAQRRAACIVNNTVQPPNDPNPTAGRSVTRRRADELHRYLHPPPGAGDVVSLMILVLGLRAVALAAGAAISADRERRRHRHHDLLRRRSRRRSRASSPRRWRMPSPRPTASTT